MRKLSALDVQKFPNTAFLLMRAVLEKNIKAFAEAKGADIKTVGNSNGRVHLGHALKWLLQYAQAEGPKSMIQPIQRVRDGKLIYMASSDSMNAVNHNHQFSVDPDEASRLAHPMEGRYSADMVVPATRLSMPIPLTLKKQGRST